MVSNGAQSSVSIGGTAISGQLDGLGFALRKFLPPVEGFGDLLRVLAGYASLHLLSALEFLVKLVFDVLNSFIFKEKIGASLKPSRAIVVGVNSTFFDHIFLFGHEDLRIGEGTNEEEDAYVKTNVIIGYG